MAMHFRNLLFGLSFMMLYALVLQQVANAYPQPVHTPSTNETKEPQSLAINSEEGLSGTEVGPRDASNFNQCSRDDQIVQSRCNLNGGIHALCVSYDPGYGYDYYTRETDCPPGTICIPNMNVDPPAARCVQSTAIVVWFITRYGVTCQNIPTDSSGTQDQLVTVEIDAKSHQIAQVPDQVSFGYVENNPFQLIGPADAFDGNWYDRSPIGKYFTVGGLFLRAQLLTANPQLFAEAKQAADLEMCRHTHNIHHVRKHCGGY